MVVTAFDVTGVSFDASSGLVEFSYALEPAATGEMSDSEKQCASMFVGVQGIIDKHKGHTRQRRARLRRFDDGWRVEHLDELSDTLDSMTR